MEEKRLDRIRAGLLSAMLKEGCPICRICADSLQNFYFYFIHESYYTPPMVEGLIASYGFCKEHAQRLIKTEAKYIISVMDDYILEGTVRKISELQELLEGLTVKKIYANRRLKKKVEKLKGALQDRAMCPACRGLEDTARNQIFFLSECLSDKKGWGKYRSSSGLCMNHFLFCLNLVPDGILLKLTEDMLERLNGLHAEIKEFIRKTNYINKGEPKGDEQSAWRRAIEQFAGRIEFHFETEKL